MAPNGQPLVTKPASTIEITVAADGSASINRQVVPIPILENIIRSAVSISGSNTPVFIIGDRSVKHQAIRDVMNACTRAGVYKLKFTALKEGL
jgi:biopolymer transport protein ExbD